MLGERAPAEWFEKVFGKTLQQKDGPSLKVTQIRLENPEETELGVEYAVVRSGKFSD